MQPYIFDKKSYPSVWALLSLPIKFSQVLSPFIILFISFCNVHGGPTQPGLPESTKFFHVFTPSDYNLGPQNRSILQHSSGLIYVGNNAGLLEYDGTGWRKYSIPDYRVWSLAENSDGHLFLGGLKGRIGYMKPDSSGRLAYKSISHDLQLGDIYDITSLGDTLYFHTQYSLLQWDGSRLHTLIADSARLFPREHKKRIEIFPGFQVNGKAIVRENKRQLKQIHNQKLLPLEFGLFANSLRVQSIIPYKDKLLLASNKQGFWFYEKNGLTNIHPNLMAESQNWGIYDGILLSDSTIAYATGTKGIVFFDPSRGITDILDKSDGLPSNKCLSITTDSEGNIWAAMEGGIVKIDYNLMASYTNASNGLNGLVSSTVRFGDAMYAATSQGIFTRTDRSRKWKTPADAPPELTGKFAWDFLQIDNELLIATSHGLFIKSLQENGFRKLEGLNSERCYSLLQSARESNRVYIFGRNIISSIYVHNGEWQVEQSPLANIPARTSTFAEDKAGRLWLASSAGVYTVHPDHLLSESSDTTILNIQNVPLNLPSSNVHAFILTIGDSIFILHADSAYAVSDEKAGIKPTNSFQGIEKVYGEKWKPYIAPDSKTIWWQSKGEFIKSASRAKGSNSYLPHPLNSLQTSQINDMYFEEGRIWFSTSSGVIEHKVDNRSFNYPQKRPLIRLLEEIDGDTLRENLTSWPQHTPLHLSSNRNNLRFRVADAAYLGNRGTEFQFKLSPQSANWSSWTTEFIRDYTFLSHGQYAFSVRMKNDFDQISEPVHFSFEILPPWYLHPLAYIFYGFLFICSLIGMVIYGRKRGFAKAEKEYLKRELQSAVETQRTLIPNKFPELEGFSLAGYYSPAADVMGDHYDAIPVEKERSMLISLADIEGKRMEGAVPATLLNGLLNGVVRNSAPKSLVEIALRIDSLFYTKLMGKKRVAILMAMLQRNDNSVKLFNAGCYPPLLLTKGNITEIDSDNLINAPLGNGMAERGLSGLTDLNEHQVLLNNRDCIILYSDGIRELKDGKGNRIFPELCETIQTSSDKKNAAEVVRLIVNFVNAAIRDGVTQTDDITLIVIQRTSN